MREEQAAATRARIVDACVSLMRLGADLTYAAVAAEAGVQERTVYRHFATKNDLETGLWQWILDHLTHADFGATTTEALTASVRASFAGFDAGAPLIQAMLHSRQGLQVRLAQQAQRKAMLEACVNSAAPGLAPELRRQATAALQVLYSATAWDLLRSFWDMDGTEAAAVIDLAIRAMLGGLTAGGSGNDPKETT